MAFNVKDKMMVNDCVFHQKYKK